MAQQTTSDNSGMGVVLGILLAIVVAVGAYFFMRGNDAGNIEPAAGNEAIVNTTEPAPAEDAPAPVPAPAR